MGKPELFEQATPGVTIKPLEWHKSHITPWNDDWHTISPFIYSIRCADENGWKWSAHGGHGYASTAAGAKADAQADYVRRIRSAIVETATPDHTALIADLVGALAPFAKFAATEFTGSIYEGNADNICILFHSDTDTVVTLGEFREALRAFDRAKALEAQP